MGSIRVLSAKDVRRALPMRDAIEGMRSAFIQLSDGTATVPVRIQIQVNEGTTIFMPAHLPDGGDLAIKVVSVFPQNVQQGLPSIHAAVLALDAETGAPKMILEGGSITAIRTGAGSGLATQLLAREDANSVAIIGSGVQARTQLEAVCTVRDIERVYVYSPTREHAESFAQDVAGKSPIPSNIIATDTAEDAVRQADIVCTATTSFRPVFDGAVIRPGTHINAVGSFRPSMQEVDVTTVQRSLIVVDSREAIMEEAGDLLVPIEAGILSEDDIHAEIGEVALGQAVGRSSDDQITYFKSVGNAAQDAVSAGIIVRNAIAMNLGTNVDW